MATNTKKKYLDEFKKEAKKEARQGTPAGRHSGTESRSRLRPETKHGILIVAIFAAALITALSLGGWAGTVGTGIATGLSYLLGWVKVIVPLLLLLVGYVLLRPQRYVFRTTNIVGLALGIVSSAGFLHLAALSLDEAVSGIASGRGGGYAGLLFSFPLERLLGPWAAGILLLAIFVISLLVMFDMSLQRLYERGNIFKRVAERGREFYYRLKMNMDAPKTEATTDGSAVATADVPAVRVRPITQHAVGTTTADATAANAPTGTAEPGTQTSMLPNAPRTIRKIDIPIDLLESSTTRPAAGDINGRKETIQRTFKNFGIEVEMGETKVGPTVTQYTLKPIEGVKLSQITTLGNDLALALAAHPIRIEAPIPGKSLVGLEVPNETVAVVKLKEILMSKEFKSRPSKLAVPIGKDVAGNVWVSDLDPMPHLLIAGSTGSGKSVCLNGIILSLLYQNSPDELKFILVDPKRVELTVYNNIPHLLTPVVTDIDKTINALRWVVSEMDRRYELLSKTGHRNIQAYNRDAEQTMPYLVLAIDELADLMSVAANEVEAAIIRLAQMARAVGIHLILATQRPSVDIITGLIKANITHRIAFAVASQIDSRTILDNSGAEKLLGRGDMLYTSPQLSKPKRLQGAFVTDQEISRVAEYLKAKDKPVYQEEVTQKVVDRTLAGDFEDVGDDELAGQAKSLVIKAGKASASLLQRRLRIGYARAARLLDILEEQGVIGPGDGAKPREILMGDSSDGGVGDDSYPADDTAGNDAAGDGGEEAEEAPEDQVRP